MAPHDQIPADCGEVSPSPSRDSRQTARGIKIIEMTVCVGIDSSFHPANYSVSSFYENLWVCMCVCVLMKGVCWVFFLVSYCTSVYLSRHFTGANDVGCKCGCIGFSAIMGICECDCVQVIDAGMLETGRQSQRHHASIEMGGGG